MFIGFLLKCTANQKSNNRGTEIIKLNLIDWSGQFSLSAAVISGRQQEIG